MSSGVSYQSWPAVYGVGLITEYCLWTMTLGAERQSGVAAAALAERSGFTDLSSPQFYCLGNEL